MALSGNFYGSTGNQYIKPRIQWRAEQSEEGNYSLLTATLSYSRTNQGYTTYGVWEGSITIDGNTKTDSRYVEITYDGNVETISHTVRVQHDSYGRKSVTIRAEGRISDTTLTGTEISQTVELDAILQASTLGASPANIGDVTVITVRRRNEASTHSIEYRFGQLQGFIGEDWRPAAQEVKLPDSSLSFTVPEEFYYEIPDAPSGVCLLTCRTYIGDELLGQPQTAEFTVTAPKERCAPLLFATVEDGNGQTLALTGDPDVLIQGHSAALCRVEATAQKGATVAQLQVNDVVMEGDTHTLANTQTGEFLFRVTDSRGYEQEYAVSKELLVYIRPTCNVAVKRTDPTSGKGRLTAKGYYYGGSFGGRANDLQVKCRVNGGNWIPLVPVLGADSYTADAAIDGLDYTKTNTVEVVAEDALCTAVAVGSVQKGIPVFDWGENDFAFHVPVAFHGGATGLELMAYPVGAIYLSVSDTDPALLFGGSWERLKDVFLLAAGDVYLAGSTGGEAEHTLDIEEMPSHSHTVPAFVEAVAGAGAFDYFRSNSSDYLTDTQLCGGSQPHNNMPPYLAVYAWKRIA